MSAASTSVVRRLDLRKSVAFSQISSHGRVDQRPSVRGAHIRHRYVTHVVSTQFVILCTNVYSQSGHIESTRDARTVRTMKHDR